MTTFGEPSTGKLGGEFKLFPPAAYGGDFDKWDDWAWQLKRYISLYKPVAKQLMDRVETLNTVVTDAATDDFDTAHGGTLRLTEFSRQLHYLLAQITEGSARVTVRMNDDDNGFETWRLLNERFSLPNRAKGVTLLTKILEFRFRENQFETDLTDFITLKTKYEKATGNVMDDDVLVATLINKTTGSLQQHLRLNVSTLTGFEEVLAIIKQYYQSRHMTTVTGKKYDDGGVMPMDIGALYWKGKGKRKRQKVQRKRQRQKQGQRKRKR